MSRYNQKGDKPELTPSQFEAGKEAFRRWVSSGRDEQAVQEFPSDDSLRWLFTLHKQCLKEEDAAAVRVASATKVKG